MGYEEACQLVESIPIYHVYGSLGPLSITAPVYIKYGEVSEYQKAAKTIKIIGENRDDEEAKAQIARLLKDAETIFMLGCGFHEENMDLLSLHILSRKVHCTTLGLTVPEETAIRELYPFLVSRNNNWNCIDFLRNGGDLQACIKLRDKSQEPPKVFISSAADT